MNTKVDGLHSLKGQPKIHEDYEELNGRLQQWYIEYTQKRDSSEGTSEGSVKKPRVNMIKGFKVGCITRDQEKMIHEVEDMIKAIEEQGKELKERKDKQIESIDKEQEEWIKVHKRLDNDTSITKTRYYGDKCYAQDKEIDLLWKKVREYEHYGDIEKHLKNVAIQELIKVKDKLRETFEAGNLTEEGDIKPNPSREWRKTWKEKEVQRSAGSTSSNKVWGTSWKEKDGQKVIESGWVEKEKEEEPRIMMIRVQSLEEREEQRIAEFQERGRQIDEEYNEMIRTHNEGQERLNKVTQECELKPNQEGLVEALIEQVIYDQNTRKKHDEVYQKERNLRREVTSYIQRRSLQIPEEPPQPSRWTLNPDEPSRREELTQAQHQAQRTQMRWPPLPG
jgi:hypothetical protein